MQAVSHFFLDIFHSPKISPKSISKEDIKQSLECQQKPSPFRSLSGSVQRMSPSSLRHSVQSMTKSLRSQSVLFLNVMRTQRNQDGSPGLRIGKLLCSIILHNFSIKSLLIKLNIGLKAKNGYFRYVKREEESNRRLTEITESNPKGVLSRVLCDY